MQVLLDECVDRRLAGEIRGHQVQTVPRMGWAGKRNGELLRLAEAQFEVFVTVDRGLPKQHDISQYDLAVVILEPARRLAAVSAAAARPPQCVKAGEVVKIS